MVAREKELFIDNLLVRIHFIIVMIGWTGLATWEFEFLSPGGLSIWWPRWFSIRDKRTFLSRCDDPGCGMVGVVPLSSSWLPQKNGTRRESSVHGDLEFKNRTLTGVPRS